MDWEQIFAGIDACNVENTSKHCLLRTPPCSLIEVWLNFCEKNVWLEVMSLTDSESKKVRGLKFFERNRKCWNCSTLCQRAMSSPKQEDEDYEEDQHGPFPEKNFKQNFKWIASIRGFNPSKVTDKRLQTGVLQSPVWSLQMRWKATDTPPSH